MIGVFIICVKDFSDRVILKQKKNHRNCIYNYRIEKKQVESSVNLISQSQNSAIPFITDRPSPIR